ncbi:MAG: response regulator transcription factor [Thermoflexales bacterium]
MTKPESARILIVEDEQILLDLLAQHLQKEGYAVITAQSGEEGLELARSQHPDLCVLDVMLPGLDGLSLCRILRRESNVPIILLTARASEIDRVIGLDTGADDYVVKPFSLPELTARIRAALRRSLQRNSGLLRVGDVMLDLIAHRVFVGEREVKLTPKEFELLATLMRNRGVVLSREALISQVWGYDFNGDIRTVDVHIRWLREKLEEDPANPKHLHTVRGVGYRMD